MIHVQPTPSLPLPRRHPTEQRVWLQLTTLLTSKLFHQRFQILAIARELDGFGAADLLIDFPHRLDTGRPLHRRVQGNPLDYRPRERRSDRRRGLAADDGAKCIAQMTDGLMRRHPSPLAGAVWGKLAQAGHEGGALARVSKIVFHKSTGLVHQHSRHAIEELAEKRVNLRG